MNDKPKSVLISMADRFGMEPGRFEQVLRATVVPANCGPEQFAAFLLVAKQYNLNPITREIYAFPGKGGGIVPIVGVDGWMRIINDQPSFDGMEFEDIFPEVISFTGTGTADPQPTGIKKMDRAPLAITCRIYRKDRSHPTEVTEYMQECLRDTPTWKQWPARMLRHKAAIQAARYAFGFSGIMEPDEYERGFQDIKSAHKARKDGDWQVLQTMMNEIKTYDALEEWRFINHDRIDKLPVTWREHFQSEFERRSNELKSKEDAAKGVVRKRGRPPKSAITEQLKASVDALTVEPSTGEIIDDEIPDMDIFIDDISCQLSVAKTIEEIAEIEAQYEAKEDNLFPPDRQKMRDLIMKHSERIEGASGNPNDA